MKRRTQIAYLSTAVAALVLIGGQMASADVLTWDSSGSSAPTPVDGGGTWDLTSTNWIGSAGTNIAWTNTTPANSAVFGNPDPTAAANGNTPYEIDLGADITAQDITLGTGSDGTPYGVIVDTNGYSITLNGNIYKPTGNGADQIFLFGNLNLSSGDHTFTINDTPGDAHPELEVAAPIVGSGNVIIDNGNYVQWGTTAFSQPGNTYTGTTTITKGRLVIANSDGLGSTAAGTTISNQGSLWLGGGGISVNSDLTIDEPITITRNTYTGTDYSDYSDALVSGNTGVPSRINTFTNLVIDSTDARIAADTSTVVLPNPLVAGPDVAAGTAVADFDGDYAGAVNLTADNTAFGAAGNSIGIMGGVELNAANDAALGGAGSNLILNGGTIHITSALLASNPAFATNFGGHTIVNGTVGTGVDVDQGLTFTVNGLSGGGVGMRGGGTLNFTGTNTFTGTPYYDGVDDGPGEGTETDTTATGVVNFEAGSSTSQKGLRIRSATVNIAGALDVSGSYTSIGVDSGGSNGTPDYGTVNVTGSGSLTETTGDDFNVSDNANTHGTITLSDNAAMTVGGTLYLGKSTGGVGTLNMGDNSTLTANSLVFVGENNGTGVLNQTGGSFVLNRTGNFTFVVSDGRNGTGSGTYNLSGGTFASAGEIYVGEGAHGNGTWNQTGGDVTFSNWFVVGREGGLGTVNISGGTMTKTGTVGADPGSQFSMGEGGSNVCTMTVSGTGVFTEQAGEFYVGNNSSVGVLNIGTAAGAQTNADATASVTVNNWFAVGRNGTSNGTVNLYDGTLTQATANWFDISGDGGSATGTVNVYGGTLNAYQMYIGENGSGTGTLNIDGGSVNLPNNTIIAKSDSVTGTLNLNGGTLTAFGFQAHNGGGTGAATFVFNGGTLRASADNTTAFVGAAVTSVVSTGGAIIDSNGHSVTINSALTHDSNLSGADGGLTKLGAGTLTLHGANTYTGATTVSAGTLEYTGSATQNLSSLSIANGAALDVSGGPIIIASGLPGYLADIQAAYDNGKWDGTSATAPVITSSFARGNAATGVGYSDSGGALKLELTWLGDTDLSGTVTASDLDAMHLMASGATWANGDFNYDGRVDGDDFALAALGAAEAGTGNISSMVPEPSALVMMMLPALAGLLPRRRRQRD